MNQIKPLFFATQISNQIKRPNTQNNSSIIRGQMKKQFHQTIVSPYEKLLKIKQQMRYAKREFFQTLSQTHKIQHSLTKLQHKKQKTRSQFVKIYGNLKYKKHLQQLITQNQIRTKSISQQRTCQTHKKKLQQNLERRLIRNQQQQKIHMLQQFNRSQKNKWNLLKNKQIDCNLNWSKQKHDLIKGQQTEFLIRKSNVNSMIQERAKFNYLKKINKQLSLVKQYQKVIDDIAEFKIEAFNQPTQKSSDIKGKTQDTFFATTNHTLSYC